MKLIVDIPDKMYETVQDGTYCGTLYEELKTATPLEESEDYVSRQAVLDLFVKNIEAVRPFSETWQQVKTLPPVKPQEPVNDFIQYAKELGKEIKVVKSDDPDTFEKIFGYDEFGFFDPFSVREDGEQNE